MASLKRFIHEIHRRSLWQVLVIYVMGGWVAFQVVESLTEGLALPDWLPAFAIILLIIGLPIVIATAFVQEGTPGRPQEELGTPAPERAPTPQGTPSREGDAAPAATGGDAALFAAEGEAATFGTEGLLTWRNAFLGGVLAFGLWGVVATVWLVRGGQPATVVAADASADIALRARADLPAVAVLPFADMSPDRDFAWFAEGVHEDILTGLSKLSGLLVLSRTSVLQYKDTQKSIRDIGQELGATALVEGSVSRSGDQVRITAQLIDADTDAHLWAENYDRNLSDVFAVRSEIALKVAEALQATLTPDEIRRVSSVPTSEMSAYDLNLEGRQAYDRYREDENERAIQLFKQAIAGDPEFALPWAGLADAYAQTVQRWRAGREWADSAVQAGQRAVALDAESSEAHKALGLAYSAQDSWEPAIDAYRSALELDPNNDGAANNLGVIYEEKGLIADAVRWYLASLRLSPNAPFSRTNLSISYSRLWLYDRAERLIAEDIHLKGETTNNLLAAVVAGYAQEQRDSVLTWLERRVDLSPTNPGDRAWTAWVTLWAGDVEGAEAHARVALRQSPNGVFANKNPKTVLGEIALMRGDTAAALEYLDQSYEFLRVRLARGIDTPYMHEQLAAIHALRAEPDEAIAELETAFRNGLTNWWYLDQETAFDSLHDDPRFQELMGRLRAGVERMREQVLDDERRAGLIAR